MATFYVRPGGYLARVRKQGVTATKTFRRKADAKLWASGIEADIVNGIMGTIPDKPFSALIEHFIEVHVVKLDGEKQDTLRLKRVLQDPIAKVKLQDLNATHVAAWRDRRLQSVSAESVRREWSSLSHACQLAKQEWHWLRDNPFREVKKPTKAEPRRRRMRHEEIDALLIACGYDHDQMPTTKQALVGAVLLFAIETAMRAGEICALTPEDIDLERRVATVTAAVRGARKTKRSREVPLSTEAIRILKQVGTFDITTATLDALFRKAKKRAMIEDLHFHDSRAEALTRLSKKLNVMQLARISGHQDIKLLYNAYFRESVEDMALSIG